MSRCSPVATLAALSIVWCTASASAETLHCQSINGNLNCVGSSGVSCQTIDGNQVCISGHGDAVQSFGKRASGQGAFGKDKSLDRSTDDLDNDGTDDDAGGYDAGPSSASKERLKHGHTLLLERNGTELHLRTNWLSLDRE
jgi:hypothetical protein